MKKELWVLYTPQGSLWSTQERLEDAKASAERHLSHCGERLIVLKVSVTLPALEVKADVKRVEI